MPDTALIAPQLPYLRRFARALTGSQVSGDAYAVATLEAIAHEPRVPEDREAARRYLFAAFFRIWSSMSLNRRELEPGGAGIVAAADRAIEAMTPLPRVAFLLRALEGFDNAAIAEIMGTDLDEISVLQEEAGREIAAQLSTGVLIIEDEVIIAMDLRALVTDLGHRVTAVARTRDEAVAAFRDDPPGLVLADIQLADGSSGIDAVNDILGHLDVPVIFVTAYPERLLTGVRPEPTFLITKPFQTDNVMAVISQALFFNQRSLVS